VCVRQAVLDAFALSVAPSSRVKFSDKHVTCQAVTPVLVLCAHAAAIVVVGVVVITTVI